MTDRNPKIVLQAHALRVDATRQALLHGTGRARAARTGGLSGLWVSFTLGALILIVIIVISRVVTLLAPIPATDHTGYRGTDHITTSRAHVIDTALASRRRLGPATPAESPRSPPSGPIDRTNDSTGQR